MSACPETSWWDGFRIGFVSTASARLLPGFLSNVLQHAAGCPF